MAAGVAACGSGTGAAQEAAAPTAAPRFVLDYLMEFEVDTNQDLVAEPRGTAANFDHTLGLTFLSETRVQSLALDTSGTARLGYDPQLDETVTEFNQGGLDLDYARRGSRSALSFGATYRQSDVEASEPFFIDTDGDTIIDEAGLSRRDATVTTLSVSTSLQTGLDRPLSTTYRFSARDRSYSDNDDPDLFDSRSATLGVTSSLRFSPVATGRVSAEYRRFEYDDVEQREGDRVSLRTGLTYTVDETLELDGSVGYSREVEEATVLDGLNGDEVTDGLVASLGFTKDRPRGEIFGDFTRNVRDNGIRTSLSVGRSLAFPRFDLRARVGVTTLDGGDPGAVFQVSYDRNLQDGGFGASIQRRVTVNTVDEENVLTSATLDYVKRLAPLTSLNVNFDVARIEETEGEDLEQRTEFGLTAAVNRSLTENWSLGVGYRGRYEEVEEGERAVSNSVFVTLGRDFILRP